MWQNSYDGSPSVYIVPTPIGNLGDMTFRAIEVLKNVSVIFSEDTRITLQLLNYYNIKNKLIHLDDHNEDNVKESNNNITNDYIEKSVHKKSYNIDDYDNGYSILCLTDGTNSYRSGYILVNNSTKEVYASNIELETIKDGC